VHIAWSRSDARENHTRLLAAAREVFAQRGVGAEIKDIAERAGVGIGTFYRHFATKDELIQAMVGEIFGQLEASLSEAEHFASVREALSHLFKTGWRLVEEHGALISALVDSDCKPHQHEDVFLRRVRALIERGVAQGELRDDVPAGFISDFLDVTMPFVYLHLRTKWDAAEAAAYCERMIMSSIIATGVRAGAGR
jgi:AcrR family transcriptional regulator